MLHKPGQYLAIILTFAGLIPFLFCAAMLYQAQPLWVDARHYLFFFLTYAVVILTFLAGIHWGLALKENSAIAIVLLISSNVMALLAWLCLLIKVYPTSLALLGFGFAVQLVIDRRLAKTGIIAGWFYGLRFIASVLVLTAIGAAAYHFHIS